MEVFIIIKFISSLAFVLRDLEMCPLLFNMHCYSNEGYTRSGRVHFRHRNLKRDSMKP